MTVKLTAQGNSYIALNLDNNIELQGDGMDLRIRYDDPKVLIRDKTTQSIIFHDDITNLLNENDLSFSKSELKEFLGAFFFITDYGNTRIQITHYQKIDISGTTTDSITFPFGATVNEKALNDIGNAYLDLLNISDYPKYETPTNSAGVAITAILDANGNWVASETSSDNIGIVYILNVSLADYNTWSDADLAGVIDSVMDIDNTKSNAQILVKQVSDFGTIVGNKITDIDSTKIYVLDGIIDMGAVSIEIPAGGMSIMGYTFDVSQLVSSEDNYTMFVSPVGGSGNVLGLNYGLTTSGTNSQVYNLTSATGFDAFEFGNINYNGCTSLGEITNYRQGLESGTGRFGGTPQLTLSGNWVGGYFIDTSIVRGIQDGAYSLYKAGAGFSMNSRFRSNQNLDLNQTVSFFDFSPSNFPNASTVQLDGCIISRQGNFDVSDTTIIPNMVASDLSAKFNGNVGIANTFVGGRKTVTTEVETIISVAGDFYDILGTWTAEELSHFDAPSNGRLRSLGVNPIEFRVQTSFVVEGTRDRDISVRPRVWDDSAGVFIDYPKQTRPINNFTGGRDVAFFEIVVNVKLEANDYILFQAANETDTSNVTMELDSYYVVEER